MRNYLLPTKRNNYTPLLLHRAALVVYVIIIFSFNLLFGQLEQSRVYAAISPEALYNLHNSTRSANGLGGLERNNQLVTSATNKAKAMLDSNCWDHYCPPGTSPWSFILNQGYQYVYAGENLGEGFTDSTALMNAWMNSPTHRANVLNGNFKEVGIGTAQGTFKGKENVTIVVVHFGSRNNAPAPTAKPVQQIKSTAVPKPTSAPQPTQVANVVIESPVEGSVINDSQPEIKGTKPEISELDILINGGSIGRVDAEGINFSYRPESSLEDGEKTLETSAYINGNKVSESTPLTFTIDTTPPEINTDSLTVAFDGEDEQQTVTITFSVNSEANSIKSNFDNVEFKKLGENIYQQSFTKNLFDDDALMVITATDAAGNQSILEIPSENILGNFEYSAFLNREIDLSDNTATTVSGSLLSTVNAGGMRTKMNFVFMLFLFALFAMDFYIIHRSGLSGVSRSKSHLHLSTVVVLILVIFLGGFGGNIL